MLIDSRIVASDGLLVRERHVILFVNISDVRLSRYPRTKISVDRAPPPTLSVVSEGPPPIRMILFLFDPLSLPAGTFPYTMSVTHIAPVYRSQGSSVSHYFFPYESHDPCTVPYP